MGRIPDEDVQRVREATDIVGLISESVVLKQKGRLYWGLCPFHQEKTASFKVDPSTQLWHCFGCGAGGDAFGFVMRIEHMDFVEAVRLLARRANIEVREFEGDGPSRSRRERLTDACEAAAGFYHRVLVSSREQEAVAAREYLAGRGFGIDVAKRFRLGYAPGRGALVRHLTAQGFAEEELVEANLSVRGERGLNDRFFGRIMFPISDLQGRTVGFGGRALAGDGPKYLNTAETPVFHKSRNLYAIDRAKNEIVKAGEAVVVEGYTDVIALHEAGVRNVVATLGTALTREHVKLLGRFARRIVYLFDADEAGLRAAERAAEFIDVSVAGVGGGAPIELAVAVVPEGLDPADYVATAGTEGLATVLADAVPLMRFVLDRRLEAHDLSSPEGRAAALAGTAKVLASVKESVLVHDYANYVADRLLVDYATVQRAVSQARPQYASGGVESVQDAGRAAVPRRGPTWVAESEYVRLAAAAVDVRAGAEEALRDGLISDGALRRVLEMVVAAGDLVGTELYERVANADSDAAEVLSGLLVDGIGDVEARVVATDVLSKLKEFALERQILEKKAQLRSLDPRRDKVEHDELFREIAALQVRLDRRRRGLADDDENGRVE